MRNLALAGLLAMAAPFAMAQTGGQGDSGGAANICQELAAFMKAPAPGTATAAGATAPAVQSAAASGGGSASGQAPPAEPAGHSQSAQQISGQSGVAVNAPAQNGAPAAGGSSSPEDAPQKSSRSAPVPNSSQGTPKDSVLSAQEAEALAKADDPQACRDAAQRLRRAGVVMPPTLLALAALEPEEPAAQPK